MTHWKLLTNTLRLQRWGSLCVALSMAFAPVAHSATRIKEVAAIEGVRSNQLTGFGLVIGLDGTGDQTTQMPYTTQGLSNYMQQLGLTLSAASLAQLQMKNVAAVLVTAQLPAFARPGQPLDINVSSLGNAKSLKGGTLIATPLKGVDGEVYAMAQGNLIVAGAGAAAEEEERLLGVVEEVPHVRDCGLLFGVKHGIPSRIWFRWLRRRAPRCPLRCELARRHRGCCHQH